MKKELMNSVKPVEEFIEVTELVDDDDVDAVVAEIVDGDEIDVTEVVDCDEIVAEIVDGDEIVEIVDDDVIAVDEEDERLKQEQMLYDEQAALSAMCFLFV